jgi:hypothetical protein
MRVPNQTIESWLMVLELVFGIVLSIIFLEFIFNNINFSGQGYLTSLIRFYGSLSLIFFFAVFSIGILGAVRFKRSRKILTAVLYSLFFWIISLVTSILLVDYLSLFSLYIILIAIVFGFNLGLRKHSPH